MSNLIVNIRGIKFGFLIGYDIYFPEVARTLAANGAEIIIIIAAFTNLKHWEILTMCRAIENQVYVVACNRVGRDKNLTFCGSSRIIDPDGTIVCSASGDTEQTIGSFIHTSKISSIRKQRNMLSDRRNSIY